jgi:ACS family hexuronate transporter-like MFS transporter
MKHLRWGIAGLLFLATLINYIDRQTLSFVAPVLTTEFKMSAPEYAFVVQAFLVAYASGFLISGHLVDRWGAKKSLSIFIISWSLASVSHVLVSSVAGLALCRFWLGISEAGNFPAATRVVSEWFPPKERGIATGIYAMGAMVGAAITPPLVIWMTLRFGWQFAFVATAMLGFLWLLAWLLFYHTPENHPLLSEAELRYISTSAIRETMHLDKRATWKSLLALPTVRGLAAASFLADSVWFFYLFWLPQYLKAYRGLSLAEIGAIAWLPFLMADIGSLAGGLFSSLMVARGCPPIAARSRALLLFMTLISLPSLWIAFSHSTLMIVVMICLVSFGCLGWMVNLSTLINDMFPAERTGSVKGIERTGSALGGILFTYLVGQLFARGTYLPLFIAMSMLHPLATLLLLYGIRSSRVAPPAADRLIAGV